MDKLKQIPARFLEIWKSWSRNQKIIIVSAVAVFIAAVVVIQLCYQDQHIRNLQDVKIIMR